MYGPMHTTVLPYSRLLMMYFWLRTQHRSFPLVSLPLLWKFVKIELMIVLKIQRETELDFKVSLNLFAEIDIIWNWTHSICEKKWNCLPKSKSVFWLRYRFSDNCIFYFSTWLPLSSIHFVRRSPNFLTTSKK